jgi:hypothetical protein
MVKTLNVRLPDVAYELLKTNAEQHHRSLNDEIIAAIEGPLFNDDDVRLAQQYLSALRAVDEFGQAASQDDLRQAEQYLATLQAIDELGQVFSEEDLQHAREYLATLRAITEATPVTRRRPRAGWTAVRSGVPGG